LSSLALVPWRTVIIVPPAVDATVLARAALRRCDVALEVQRRAPGTAASAQSGTMEDVSEDEGQTLGPGRAVKPLTPRRRRRSGPSGTDTARQTGPADEHGSTVPAGADTPGVPGTEAAESDAAPPVPRRGSRPVRDMALSLSVLVIPIMVMVWLFNYLGSTSDSGTADPEPVFEQARTVGLQVMEPVGLDEDWRPTTVVLRRVDGAYTMRVGYVTSQDGLIQLIQSETRFEKLLADELGEGVRPEGTVEINGVQWEWYPGRQGARALVMTQPDRDLTVIVLGRATDEELQELAASLR